MSNLEYNRGKGFTLVEMIMVIVIVGILSVPAAYILMHFVQNAVYLPNQLNTDMVLADTLNLLIDGDATAAGLRCSQSMTSIAANDLTFVNQDGHTVRYRLDTGTGKLYRSIDGGAENLIPYYVPAAITMSGIGNTLFVFYDSTETATATAEDVRWIHIGLSVQDGSGSVEAWEGSSEGRSAIHVPRF